jgi:hypothetical protein
MFILPTICVVEEIVLGHVLQSSILFEQNG